MRFVVISSIVPESQSLLDRHFLSTRKNMKNKTLSPLSKLTLGALAGISVAIAPSAAFAHDHEDDGKETEEDGDKGCGGEKGCGGDKGCGGEEESDEKSE
jgi:hypothetical protein